MAGTTLTATILGVDKASPVLEKVGNKATQVGSKFKAGAAMATGALAGIGVASFLKDSISAFTDAQAQTQKLEDAFAKFPALGDTTAAAIEQVSSALEAKTKFDDDATNGAAATLAQFDLTGQQIQTLLPLMQDYAVATGMDLPSAATALGKAMEGNTKGLKTVGINYKSTGDKAQDFQNIVGLLGQKVGGFAENEGKTAAGQLEILKNQFGEVEETVGSALVPALVDLGHVAIPLLEDLGSAVKSVVGFIDSVPGPVKEGAIAFAAYKFITSTDLFGKIAGSISNMKVQIKESTLAAEEGGGGMSKFAAAGGVAKKAGSGLFSALGGPWGVAIAGGVAGVALLTSKIKDWTPPLVDVTSAVDANTGALTDNATAVIAQQLASDGSFELATKMGIAQGDLTLAIEGNKAAYQSVTTTIGKYAAAHKDDMKAQTDSVRLLSTVTKSTTTLATAQKDGADAASEQAAATAKLAGQGALGGMGRPLKIAQDETYKVTGALGGMGKAMQVAKDHVTYLSSGFITAQANTVAYRLAVEAAKDKAKTFGTQQGILSAALFDTKGKTRDLSSATDLLRQAMDRAAGLTPDLTDATRDWEQALSDTADKAKDSAGKTHYLGTAVLDAKGNFNLASQKGRDLSSTMETLGSDAAATAVAAGDLAKKQHGVAAGTKAAHDSLVASRAEFIRNAHQMGLTGAQAKLLADKYFAIPTDITTVVVLDKSKAAQDLQHLADTTIYIPIKTSASISHGYTVNNRLADGGWITGGTPGRDSVPVLTMPGEFVVSAKAARANAGLLEQINGNRHGSGYASGSRVAAMPAARGGDIVINVQVPNGAWMGTMDQLVLPLSDAVKRATRNGLVGSFSS